MSRPGPEQSGPPICMCDNWRIVQARELDIGLWTGTTTLVFQGYGLPWLTDADNDPGGAGPHEGGESEEDIDSSTEYEDASSPRSRSRSRTRSSSHGRAGAERDGEGKGPGTSGESETLLHPEAVDYLNTIKGLDQPTKQGWERVLDAGDALLCAAGGVQEAAQWLWDARATHGLANLRGVEDPCLDKILHPDLLAYLRHVKRHGMEARHVGPRERAMAGLHPNAKRNLEQVYAQIWKDVKKHRVLVASQDHPKLGNTMASPFEAVPKLLPDRSVSNEVRVVHDQRSVNQGTHKDFHPPALQPTHDQIARRVLFLKHRYPRRTSLGLSACSGWHPRTWSSSRGTYLGRMQQCRMRRATAERYVDARSLCSTSCPLLGSRALRGNGPRGEEPRRNSTERIDLDYLAETEHWALTARSWSTMQCWLNHSWA